MKEIEFFVQGSAFEPYKVTFIKENNNLNAFCTCPAGQNGLYCKHRLAILTGDVEALTSENKDQVATIHGWLSGTDLQNALIDLAEAEKQYDVAKERLTTVKKKIAQAMRK